MFFKYEVLKYREKYRDRYRYRLFTISLTFLELCFK